MNEEKENKRIKIIITVSVAVAIAVTALVIRAVFVEQGCAVFGFGKLMSLGSSGIATGFISFVILGLLLYWLFILVPNYFEDRKKCFEDEKNRVVVYRRKTDWKLFLSIVGIIIGALIAIGLISTLLGYIGWILLC